ncbi:hypothetical protein UlMin_027652 [Ulmus minor]
MGGGSWLRIIVCSRKIKESKSKQGVSCVENEKDQLQSSSAGCSASNDLVTTTKSVEDVAVTRIQAVFRAFLARRQFMRLKRTEQKDEISVEDHVISDEAKTTVVKGTMQLQGLVEDHSVRAQVISALNHIHSWGRIQEEIRARRLCMVREARIKQKKLENQIKLEAKLHELEVEWCGGTETMEEIICRIQQREEAAIKRERAMAYAFLHQWRANSSQFLGQATFNLGTENWGWSWTERWVAARPWEIRVVANPTILKKPLTTYPKVPALVTSSSTLPNGNCKNRKTCSTQPQQI